MELVLALAAGLLLGALLGVLGGGGGIIAVPVLLALGESMDAASTTSLVVVGIGAATGLLMQARSGRVEWRIGLVFGALGVVGAVVGSRLAFWSDDRIQLGGFAILLVVAAWGMLRRRSGGEPTGSASGGAASGGARAAVNAAASGEDLAAAANGASAHPVMRAPVTTGHETSIDTEIPAIHWGRVLIAASIVGLITGFFGVGGGFVAVPALVLALRMPMKQASATALLVILVNVIVAFAAHGVEHVSLDLTITVSAAAAVGAVAGVLLQGRINAVALQRAFGVLLLAAAAYELVALLRAL